MSDEKLLNELFGTSVSSPARAKAVERQKQMEKLAAKMEADDGIEGVFTADSDLPDDFSTEIIKNDNFAPSYVPEPVQKPNEDSIFIKNDKVPVQLTVSAGKNAMSGAPTFFTLSFEAHDVQVSEDMISILYRHDFTIAPPAFTQVKLKVRSTSYNAMCISAARKLGPFTDMSFVIVQSQENGEESSSASRPDTI